MSRKEILIKWKTVEEQTPLFPDGVIFIKEDTSIEYPLALVPIPQGRHKLSLIHISEPTRPY